MKSKKITKLLGIALVISLLALVIPASPALAAALLLSPTAGQIGDSISVTGSGFAPTTIPADGVFLYFSDHQAIIGQAVGTHVTRYATVGAGITTGVTGSFVHNFTVPTTYIDYTHVTSGTHYLYACQPATSMVISAVATFTIVGGEISIDPEEGIVDTLVEITGTSFPADQPITIEFDGDEIDIEDGDDETDDDGEFVSYILIPESTAGVQDIDVTVSGYTVTAQFTVEPDIYIYPQSGKPGDTVSVSGTGFARRPKLVDIYFNNTYLQSVQPDTNGSFYIPTLEIPDLGLSQGTYTIEAEDEDMNLASASFTLNVTPPTTTPPTTTPPTTTPPPDESKLNISSSGDTIGSLIGIGGTGFTPNGTAIVKYDSVEVATVTIEPTGAFLVTFQVPPSVGGNHTITVTDGINTAETTYTVETTAPDIPQPIEPALGARINSPFSFDWEDVTDESQPVTYDLQISGASSFSQASILIERTNLTSSQYELTEQEGSNLVGRDAPYYWRVKAIDAASNEGDWSGIGEFYVAPPFSFPTWAIIVLAIFGALILFGVGYWLGRRTAFFY
ncbi:MAG TPA: hypothetical protein G4O16_09555 [Dehalococcoidia bacterium]|nr:hypothetical protein [Dehalococcoidia bacterium]